MNTENVHEEGTKKGACKCRCEGADGRISMKSAEAVNRAIKNAVTQKYEIRKVINKIEKGSWEVLHPEQVVLLHQTAWNSWRESARTAPIWLVMNLEENSSDSIISLTAFTTHADLQAVNNTQTIKLGYRPRAFY